MAISSSYLGWHFPLWQNLTLTNKERPLKRHIEVKHAEVFLAETNIVLNQVIKVI